MDFQERLDKTQYKAVSYTDGPELIYAGPGSGKTRVLTFKIAYLIQEKQIRPDRIVAITFTNKAAEEMRRRVRMLTGNGFKEPWIATFHSTCLEILRETAWLIGYEDNFEVIDEEDAVLKINRILHDKSNAKRTYLKIKECKQNMITPAMLITRGQEALAKTFETYLDICKRENVMDFEDLLLNTIRVLKEFRQIKEIYENKIEYLLVDEFQDTDRIQMEFIRLLTARKKNICVVGDDDQAIYDFRGADVENLLSFNKIYPGTKVFTLRENYRSTNPIVQAAQTMIENNKSHIKKDLYGERDGFNVVIREFKTDKDEAENIVNHIKMLINHNDRIRIAVLYRSNYIVYTLENELAERFIPYTKSAGTSFYKKKEIKDAVAYLKVITGSKDAEAIKRVLTTPRRGIGQVTIDEYLRVSKEDNISFLEAMSKVPKTSKLYNKIMEFLEEIRTYKANFISKPIYFTLKKALIESGYIEYLKNAKEDKKVIEERINSINTFLNQIRAFEELNGKDNYAKHLEEISLQDDDEIVFKNVLLSTIHAAKGLEFDYVFIIGAENGQLPSYQAKKKDMETERRLMYVAMTRAISGLTISYAKTRTIYGKTDAFKRSLFIDEMPLDAVDIFA